MIVRADAMQVEAVTDLALRLFPGHDREALRREYLLLLEDRAACALFLALADAQPVGFAQVQLRHDYVEGTASRPVGYLEGVYGCEDWRQRGLAGRLLLHCEDWRQRGLAGRLLLHCEDWARAQGCTEFASDCELDNDASLAFHLQAGFAEAGRIICFTKKL